MRILNTLSIAAPMFLAMQLSLCYCPSVLAQKSTPPLETQKIDSQFVCTNTIAIAKLQTAKIALPTFLKASPQIVDRLELLKSIASNDPAYVFLDIPFAGTVPLARVYVKDPGEPAKAEIEKQLSMNGTQAPKKYGEYLGFAPGHSMDQIQKSMIRDAAVRTEFAEAMKLVADYPIQLAVAPPEYLRKAIREMMPNLPQKLGGGSSSLVTDGIRWAAIGFDPTSLKLAVTIQSESQEAAKALDHQAPLLAKQILSQIPGPQQSFGNSILSMLAAPETKEVKGSQLLMHFDLSKFDTIGQQLVTESLSSLASTIDKTGKMEQFKQLALACHNFENAHHVLPPGKEGRDKNGKSLLSWRVHILPYLDQSKLYSQFHLNEAWDSPHNKQLLDQMPDVFKNTPLDLLDGSQLPIGYTTIVAPIGKDTIFGQSKPITFGHITDGTSNTVWMVEVKPKNAVPWTAPNDYEFDPKKPVAGLNVGPDGMILVGLADGSVQYMKADMDAERLVHLFEKSDGNVIE